MAVRRSLSWRAASTGCSRRAGCSTHGEADGTDSASFTGQLAGRLAPRSQPLPIGRSLRSGRERRGSRAGPRARNLDQRPGQYRAGPTARRAARRVGHRAPHGVGRMAAFCHPNPAGSRFATPTRGVWYTGRRLETAIAESVYHRGRELREIGITDARLECGSIRPTSERPSTISEGWRRSRRVSILTPMRCPRSSACDCFMVGPMESSIQASDTLVGNASRASARHSWPTSARPPCTCSVGRWAGTARHANARHNRIVRCLTVPMTPQVGRE